MGGHSSTCASSVVSECEKTVIYSQKKIWRAAALWQGRFGRKGLERSAEAGAILVEQYQLL